MRQGLPADARIAHVAFPSRHRTVVDLSGRTLGPRAMSLTAELYAVLDDGHQIALLTDRGWTEALRGGRGDEDIWTTTQAQHVVDTARVVVGPDEPFGDATQVDAEAGYWTYLATVLAASGVVTDADSLRQLDHDVVLSGRVREQLRTST